MAAIDIVIQNVVYNPAGGDVDGEYVIIANRGIVPVDMTDWTLRDTLQHRLQLPFIFTFPHFILAPGNIVRIHTGRGIKDDDDLYWGRSQAVWNNTGDIAVLSDQLGQEMSRFSFLVEEFPNQPFPVTVVISDIHIGDNSRTCWYQKSVHEPYILAMMDWIIQRAADRHAPVERLIILGDFFDFWTYPPDQRPPTTRQILEANQNLFGPNGKMHEVMNALNGNVLYVHGNHDINITQTDLDLIPTGLHKIKLVDDIYYDNDRILYTHGHLFTMFNAPDPRYPGQVPVGHFVTRAVAYYVNNILQPGQTAANLPDQGSPYGFDLSSFAAGLSNQLSNTSITSALLDYMSERTELDENHHIMMADGTFTTIALVKNKYDNLWSNWVASSGSGEFGETVALKAAQADYDGTYMGWFAQRVAMQHSALGTIMGHSHNPKSGIQNSSIRYVNSGFACPSIPDIISDKAHVNFATVDSQSNLQLWQVNNQKGSFEVSKASASRDQVVLAHLQDFSCYVRITNNTDNDLFKKAQVAQFGNYVVPAPNSIPANTTADIWLQDAPGIHGAEGSITYSKADGSSNGFIFGCPTGIFDNYASGGAAFIATSVDPPSSITEHNQVPTKGHPLFVEFFTGPIPGPPWMPTSLLALAVFTAGFLYDPVQDIIYSRKHPFQRLFGYAYGYDAAALAMDAIIDCEPIFFDYAGKHWMIELWKGQYGLETGGEIGIYNRQIGSNSLKYVLLDKTVGQRIGDSITSHKLFFDCVNDTELLEMSFTLYKNGQRLFSRGPENHWWLTGFKWGVYSRPEELTMDISINCRDTAMCIAVACALEHLGYTFDVSSTTVQFKFENPRTQQPRYYTPQTEIRAVELRQQGFVNAFNAFGFPNNDPNTIPDSALAMIMNAVGIYSADFFAQVVADLAKGLGLNVYDVINGLNTAFNIGTDVATDLATQAGYVFSNWVGAVENALGINLNFSCVVEISNRVGPYDLILENHRANHGNYVVSPPEKISAGRVGRFWLKDPKASPYGADGWAQYYYFDSAGIRNTVKFTYACPTGWESNVAASSPTFNFYTKSGSISSGWSAINQIKKDGHPLFVAFVYGNSLPPG